MPYKCPGGGGGVQAVGIGIIDFETHHDTNKLLGAYLRISMLYQTAMNAYRSTINPGVDMKKSACFMNKKDRPPTKGGREVYEHLKSVDLGGFDCRQNDQRRRRTEL